MPRTPDRQYLFEQLYPKVNEILAGSGTTEDKLFELCKRLYIDVNWYDWVGFYLVDTGNPPMLVLGPYVGESTDHIQIPFGRGVCGQVAEHRETRILDDVSQESNYLSCSRLVQSEIVVPILKEDKLVGVLDIDSHSSEAFNNDDKDFLEGICNLLLILF
jgi:GAF domain-containing protein